VSCRQQPSGERAPLCRASPSGVEWSFGGQRERNNLFAPRVDTVLVIAGREAVRTGTARLDETLCELRYVTDPCGSTLGQDRWPRLGGRLRRRRPLIELLVGCHDADNYSTRSQKWLWGNVLDADLGGLRATLCCFRWNGRNSVPNCPRGHPDYPEATPRPYGSQPVATQKPP